MYYPRDYLRGYIMKWNEWMAKVSMLLHATHGVPAGDVRPTEEWRQLWRGGVTPAAAAVKLAKQYHRKMV